MSGRYQPFRNLRSTDDLLLVKRELKRNPATIRMPADPYYPEICAWVNVRCEERDLFSPEGQTLLEATPAEGEGWRLSVTPYGYLRFEGGEGEGRLECDSPLPVHAVVDVRKEFRLGLALLDLEDPRKCLLRSTKWMFGPEMEYERTGDVSDVVFPCGYTLGDDGDTINLYYGAADTSIALASGSIREMLDWLKKNSTPGDRIEE